MFAKQGKFVHQQSLSAAARDNMDAFNQSKEGGLSAEDEIWTSKEIKLKKRPKKSGLLSWLLKALMHFRLLSSISTHFDYSESLCRPLQQIDIRFWTI